MNDENRIPEEYIVNDGNETGVTMDYIEQLIRSGLRDSGLVLRAPNADEHPNVPRPEDVDTGDRKRLFKGIKQVTFDEYESLTEEDRKQYMFFVRESSGATFGFIGIGNLKYTMVPEDIRGIDVGYFPEICPQYLNFTSLEDGNYIGLERFGECNPEIYYSLDYGQTWNNWREEGYADIPLANRRTVKMYGNNPDGFSTSDTVYARFTTSKKTDCKGNVMGLISNYPPESIPNQYCFYSLFSNTKLVTSPEIKVEEELKPNCFEKMFYQCTELVSGPTELFYPNAYANTSVFNYMFYGCTSLVTPPNITLASFGSYSLQRMFCGCTSLVTPPEMTNVTGYIYFAACRNMFTDCTSLTSAPVLNMEILADNCYSAMFENCTSLVQAPELPSTHIAQQSYYSMFKGCTSLVHAPELPSTTIPRLAYQHMFNGCTSLTELPDLPATAVTENCYEYMFSNCTSLTYVPTDYLPVTTLAVRCYNGMFNGCTSLTSAPELPATTLAEGCYAGMFSNCTSLTTPPELPATTLTESCYENMFYWCGSLRTAPELPATILTTKCYNYMFSGCVSLTEAPELPAEILTERCYYHMFYLCYHLNYIKCLATDISATECTKNWVQGVAPTGLFVKTDWMEDWEIDSIDGIPIGWTIYHPLTFNITSDGIINWFASASDFAKTIKYSSDCGHTWTEITSSAPGASINVASGDKLIFRGNNSGYGRRADDFNGFSGSTAEFEVSGYLTSLSNDSANPNLNDYGYQYLFAGCSGLTSVENLILPSLQLARCCYSSMFENCILLTNVPTLPATNLSTGCYYNMFQGCSSLTSVPSNYLPATTLRSWCYNGMFKDCTSLTTLPELPAEYLVDQCYQNMFSGCISLTSVPSDYLPSTNMAFQCYCAMFYGCTNLTAAPELPATTLVENCYTSMFLGCTSLTVAPELPAEILAPGCYRHMFAECSSLNYVKCLATDISANNCTFYFLYGVSPNGTFVKNASMNDWIIETSIYASHGIPGGWTVQDA